MLRDPAILSRRLFFLLRFCSGTCSSTCPLQQLLLRRSHVVCVPSPLVSVSHPLLLRWHHAGRAFLFRSLRPPFVWCPFPSPVLYRYSTGDYDCAILREWIKILTTGLASPPEYIFVRLPLDLSVMVWQGLKILKCILNITFLCCVFFFFFVGPTDRRTNGPSDQRHVPDYIGYTLYYKG